MAPHTRFLTVPGALSRPGALFGCRIASDGCRRQSVFGRRFLSDPLLDLRRLRHPMAQPPKAQGLCLGIDTFLGPPTLFVADGVKRPVMGEAERYGPFVRDLVAHSPRLCEAEMMRMNRHPTADETRLDVDELQMLGISNALRRTKEERRFIDRLRRKQFLLRLAVLRLPQPLLGALGIALEDISVMHALGGLELRPGKPQPLDRRLVVIEHALKDARQRRLVDPALQAGAKTLGGLMLADDLATGAEKHPRLRLVGDQGAVIPRARGPSNAGLLPVIESETEEIAEGDQRPFGRIGLGLLERTLMRLAEGCPVPCPTPLPSRWMVVPPARTRILTRAV